VPSDLSSGAGVGHTRARCSEAGRADDFRRQRRELYLAATDLDTCERIVLGAREWEDVPISTEVMASTALPMAYKP
jgi:NTE family protein